MQKTIVLLSGGLDSSVLLAQMRFENRECFALAVDYGQKHRRELASADAIANWASVPLTVLSIGPALAPIFSGANSSQVGQKTAVPHGHYAAENMKVTIVPNRNMLLLALAGAYAESIGASFIAYAAHAGDHAIYPDCRPEFFESCAMTLDWATDHRVELIAPFGRITKTDIARRGAGLHVPFELTWSCYDSDLELHCGKCGTCQERIEAFRDSGVPDPTRYAKERTHEPL